MKTKTNYNYAYLLSIFLSGCNVGGHSTNHDQLSMVSTTAQAKNSLVGSFGQISNVPTVATDQCRISPAPNTADTFEIIYSNNDRYAGHVLFTDVGGEQHVVPHGIGTYLTYVGEEETSGKWDNGIYSPLNPQIESDINNLNSVILGDKYAKEISEVAINTQLTSRKMVKYEVKPEGTDKVVYLGRLVNGVIPGNESGILVYTKDGKVLRAFKGIVNSHGAPNSSAHGLLVFYNNKIKLSMFFGKINHCGTPILHNPASVYFEYDLELGHISRAIYAHDFHISEQNRITTGACQQHVVINYYSPNKNQTNENSLIYSYAGPIIDVNSNQPGSISIINTDVIIKYFSPDTGLVLRVIIFSNAADRIMQDIFTQNMNIVQGSRGKVIYYDEKGRSLRIARDVTLNQDGTES